MSKKVAGSEGRYDPTNDKEGLANKIQSAINVAIEHEAYLESVQPETVDSSDSDDDLDSSSPIFDEVYDTSGNQGVITLTNFTSIEFSALYDLIAEHVTVNWNVGRGRKSTYEGKDVFMLALSVVKMGGKWDEMALPWKLKPATFQAMIMKFIEAVNHKLYAVTVKCLQDDDGWMARNIEDGHVFKNYPSALYATDVRFQMANRPTGNHQESKVYFSKKHGLYGYKEEASVMASGMCVHLSRHYKGSCHDLSIFKDQYHFHSDFTLKKDEDKDLPDDDSNQDHWAILMDKGYQGSAEFCRSIIPTKKPIKSSLSAAEKLRNKNVSSDRIIVENYFGRKVSLWGLMARKYRWDEGKYDLFASFCTSLTNFHIHLHPLRGATDTDDFKAYVGYKQRMKDIAEDISATRARTQKRYNSKRKARLQQKYHSATASPKRRKSTDEASCDSDHLID